MLIFFMSAAKDEEPSLHGALPTGLISGSSMAVCRGCEIAHIAQCSWKWPYLSALVHAVLCFKILPVYSFVAHLGFLFLFKCS